MKKELTGIGKTVLLGLFLAAGMILAIFETYIPRPLPWAKPGLANVVTIIIIYLFGFRDALIVNCARVALVHFVIGGFAGPGFWLAFIASAFSAITMYAVVQMAAYKVGPVGVSIVGAYTHIIAQLLIAGLFIVGRLQVLHLLPLFIIPSFFAGIVVGLFSYFMLVRLEKRFVLKYTIPVRNI